ncbi:MAG: hypothetical protein FWF10_04235 [Clostridiales bacterium]|nr:hypothetical protein [Clostridiales bacterium]
MKRFFVIGICILCILLDLVALPAPLPSIPIAVFAACLALAAMQPLWQSLSLAATGGLILDLLRNTALGLTPALYILAALAFAAVYKKSNQRARAYVPTAAGLFFAIQFLYAAAASLLGRTQPYLRMLLLQCVPISLLAALLCRVFCKLFHRLLFERRRV